MGMAWKKLDALGKERTQQRLTKRAPLLVSIYMLAWKLIYGYLYMLPYAIYLDLL